MVHDAALACADESDDEQEVGRRLPSSRISTSMVKQATAHLHRDGRYISYHIPLHVHPEILSHATTLQLCK